ncbi:MAG: class I SAM-dependent methyltransferase [Phycisphaeraceae bacterium]
MPPPMATPPCPLCQADQPAWHYDASDAPSRPHARYTCCAVCGLVSMHPADRPSRTAEHAHYALHENCPDDPGYRRFLAKLADPLVPKLPAHAHGLDYGSGPGPTLSLMLEAQGLPMTLYDPAFAPDPDALRRRYEFITCTETAEHFHNPAAEFARLDALLRPAGWLAVMTEMLQPGQPFADWWYRRDSTHVCFYQPRTMHWLATRFRWQAEHPHPNVTLFHKPAERGD